jgi:hypothetical protein
LVTFNYHKEKNIMSDEIKEPQQKDIRIPPTVTAKRSMKDNKILAWLLSTILYPVLFLGALIASATMTFDVIGMILPGNLFMQYLAIAFYDFGALVWFLMFVVKARGARQRGASLFVFAVDLAGAAFMIYADLNLAGQTLIAPPAWLGRWLINGTTLVMFLNLAAAYYYHMTSPEDLAAADDQDRDDEIEEVTRAQQRAYLEANIHTLAAPMFARSVARFKMRNGLQLTDADYNALEGIIDGTVSAPQLTDGNRDGFWRAFGRTLVNFLGGALRLVRSSLPSEMNTPSLSNPSPSDEPTPDPNNPPQV